MDDYFRTYAGLGGAPYDWTWNKPKGALTYEWCKKHGSDCSRSIDVTCTRLGLPDPGDTVEIAKTIISGQPYPRGYNANVRFLRGTVLVNGTAGSVAGDQSHVAIVSDSKNQTVAHCREYPEPSGVHMDDDLKQVDLIARFEWVGYLPALGVDYDPLAGFCGHFSPPSLLAIWMAMIARFRYQIPEVLPVMCSMQELKDAWIPKALPYYAVRGYSNNDNHSPLGLFQQASSRAWGTAEEILDPNHALGAFCQEAATQRRAVDETDPAQLGEWIADVQQRSREDLKGEYAKHYETAIDLIASGRALLPEEYRYDVGDSRFPSEPGRTAVDNACRRPPTRSTELKSASELLAGISSRGALSAWLGPTSPISLNTRDRFPRCGLKVSHRMLRRPWLATRLRLLPEFLAVVALGFALYAGMLTLQAGIEPNPALLSFDEWVEKAAGSPLYRFLWFVGNLTEAQFYASVMGGVGILTFAYLAYLLDRVGSKWRGFSISYGTGLWPWILVATLTGLGLSVSLFGHLLSGGWVPTFVPLVSVPAGIVFIYGGGWRKALTGGVLGGLIAFPIAYFLMTYASTLLSMPAVVWNVTGMCLGGAIVFELCRALPWMRREKAPPAGEHAIETGEATELRPPAPVADPTNRGWFGRRVLADFSEAQFYGTELASAGLILGTILGWVLNPWHPAFGSGLLPAILLSQILAAAVGIFLYYERWRDLGWYPTFVPMVSVAPATVLIYAGTMQSILAGAVLGAVAGPPVAQFVIDRLPGHWHLYIGNTFSMAICTATIVPVLELLPGF